MIHLSLTQGGIWGFLLRWTVLPEQCFLGKLRMCCQVVKTGVSTPPPLPMFVHLCSNDPFMIRRQQSTYWNTCTRMNQPQSGKEAFFQSCTLVAWWKIPRYIYHVLSYHAMQLWVKFIFMANHNKFSSQLVFQINTRWQFPICHVMATHGANLRIMQTLSKVLHLDGLTRCRRCHLGVTDRLGPR